MNKIIVAIDGHSSCGKSTIAKSLAKHLHYLYIDTGAMYRAVALYCARKGFIHPEGVDREAVIEHLPVIHVVFEYNAADGSIETFLNGENVEKEIRGVEVSNQVTKISQIREVREKLIALQREMGAQKGVVMDGRDIGTVVFPQAELKLYVTADIDIRAKRRYDQMIANGKNVTFEAVKENLQNRDYDDIHKGDRPLQKANDAHVLDTSHLTREEQFQEALKYIQQVT